MVNDSLGDRMKNNYEDRAKSYLIRRTPVIIRLDGKAFHTFTRGFKRPYDEVFHYAMNITTKYLCENIQGCRIGYTQSDEISLLLTDFNTITTDAWFDYNVQKMCSVAASMCTMAFNYFFEDKVLDIVNPNDLPLTQYWWTAPDGDEYGAFKMALFDARCFNIPKEEITNYFIWRQQDAIRNATQMLGQCNFSFAELQSKSCEDIKIMLNQKGIDFDAMPMEFKYGVCCVKKPVEILCKDRTIMRKKWVIDKEIPIFTQYREYIEDQLLWD